MQQSIADKQTKDSKQRTKLESENIEKETNAVQFMNDFNMDNVSEIIKLKNFCSWKNDTFLKVLDNIFELKLLNTKTLAKIKAVSKSARAFALLY